MILIDTALRRLAEEDRCISVGIYGAGSMAKGLTRQLTNSVPGISASAICNRTIDKALNAYRSAGFDEIVVAETQRQLDDAILRRQAVVTDDPSLLASSDKIDCLVDLTGSVPYGAKLALLALANKKHLILVNAELDATLGPILSRKATQAGIILTCADGDQPGVQMNLYRYVKTLGFIPRLLGNIKGLHDCNRNPSTQADFAREWDQSVDMVTSFADGSKVNFEQCVVANATGFTVAKRGMLRYAHHGHVNELVHLFDLDYLRSFGGIVDFVVGAAPAPGVFCLAELGDSSHSRYLEIYKLGKGPLYSFYQPYHLCHFEFPLTIARAVLFNDSCGHSLAGPQVEVVAIAKRDLRAGEVLDSYGGYMTYGEAEQSQQVQACNLVPQGLVQGCRLDKDVPRGVPLRWSDLTDLPEQEQCFQLYVEQRHTFSNSTSTIL